MTLDEVTTPPSQAGDFSPSWVGDRDATKIPRRRRAPLADELAEAARDLTRPPGPQSTDKVAQRGDPLGTPVHWQGRQWAVTPHGVECRDGTYYIEKGRLWESDDTDHGWVHHMAEKNWVDLEDFAEALRVGRRRFARPRRGRG
jgi:hypothetical protein